MKNGSIFVSELSTSRHAFRNYHFCRGNSKRRKSRLGVIIKGNGSYIYHGKQLRVSEGSVVFIPENIYCYSEWHGTPSIEVVYLSCFIHYEEFRYEPQIIDCSEKEKSELLEICGILSDEDGDGLEAYARFYRVLQAILPKMAQSKIVYDKTTQAAIEYITSNYSKDFSVSDLSKICLSSESTIYHSFRKTLGQSPIEFLNSIRINVAIDYLENTGYSISTICQLTGFHSENHFRKIFKNLVGTTPLKYRKSR